VQLLVFNKEMGQCNTCNTKTSRDAGDKLDYSNPASRQK
jgi:hypothetical protein